ncbi:helix-turn-helix transcriptional regulator [Nocardioides acrostichi]|uniref:HTH luxR-type domain-containing protein n=1 Tax=Nocardioides acrostichi TaxID=2784339 RepID=A0A930UYQ6_9ACTN|nr:LuxR C-terminal-related transcriptional regulator [Nocardioides acrostichi]MBF4163338.1 hypothetical protein [Nocardioides acrostichi]
MSVEKETWEFLGLKLEDLEVYRAWLSEPGSSSEALAAHCGLPASTVAESRRRLAGAGLVRRIGPETVPADPATGFGRMATLLRHQLDEVEHQAQLMHHLYAAGRRAVDPRLLFDIVTGSELIVDRLSSLLDATEEDAVFCDAPPYIAGPTRSLSPWERRALERGVQIRVLHGQGAYRDPEHVEALHEGMRLGLRSRVYRNLSLKIAIFDERTAVMPLSLGTDLATMHAVFITHEPFVRALGALFELMWDQGTPSVPDVDDEQADKAQASQIAILRLMASGFSDGAIARQLSISDRTLRRRVLALEEQLGANNRFQLALLASEAGLVHGTDDEWAAHPGDPPPARPRPLASDSGASSRARLAARTVS